MQLKADDGSLLEVKEATVIDSHGEVLSEPSEVNSAFHASGRLGGVRVIQATGWMAPLFVILVVLVLTFGAVFLGGFLLLALGVASVKKILRALGVSR
jgi:hypothetical protein